MLVRMILMIAVHRWEKGKLPDIDSPPLGLHAGYIVIHDYCLPNQHVLVGLYLDQIAVLVVGDREMSPALMLGQGVFHFLLGMRLGRMYISHFFQQVVKMSLTYCQRPNGILAVRDASMTEGGDNE